jgi:hypothetical protein
MVTIEFKEPWTFRTPLVTIDYAAGTHSVFKYIADQAEAEGVIASAAIGSADPLDGSVPQLTEYLAGVHDVKELQRMRKAEVGGKTRSTAIDAIDVRIAELEAVNGQSE